MKISQAAVIEPNPTRYKALCEGLKKAGLKVSKARAAAELGKETLVVVGTSVATPSRVAREVRRAAPTALVLAARSRGFAAPWADGILPLPVSPNDLKVRLAERARAARDGATSAPRMGEGILDETTHFYTFSHFKEVLFVEVKRARRYGFPLALAVVAFDGAPPTGAGDLAAQLMGGLALAIRRSLRDTDFPVQLTPDRVLLLMPHTDLAGSLIVARRICERVARASLQVGDTILHPTISVGVSAGAPGREYSFSGLVKQAQEGLAVAMEHGGNRVEFLGAADDQALANQGTQEDAGIPRIPPVVAPEGR